METLLGGTLAIAQAVAAESDAGTLPTESVPNFTKEPEVGSFSFGASTRLNWRLIIDDAYSRVSDEPAVVRAVEAISARLPPAVRNGEYAGLVGPSEPPARVFSAFCELLFSEGANPARIDHIADDIFQATDTAVAELESFCKAERHRVVVMAPLSGVALSDQDLMAIQGSMRVRRVDDAERQRLWRSAGISPHPAVPGSVAFETFALTEVEAVAEVVVDLRLGESFVNWAPAQKSIEQLVEAIRLLGPGEVNWIAQWPAFPEQEVFTRRFSPGGISRPGRRGPFRREETLTLGDSTEVREVYERLAAAENWEGERQQQFELAMRRFSQTYDRASDEDRLIDSWIAFEALFLPESDLELNYRAQMRIARFVGDALKDREHLRNQLKESYKARSAIVHGSRPKKVPQGDIARRADETVDMLRRALRRWIHPDWDGSAEALDRDLLS